MTIQAPWDAVDTGWHVPDAKPVPNKLPQGQPARVQQLPPDELGTPELLVQGGSGMIFLRHSETGWHVRFFGVPGVGGKNELPLPCPSTATLAQVIERLQGRFPACWLLVSP